MELESLVSLRVTMPEHGCRVSDAKFMRISALLGRHMLCMVNLDSEEL